MLFPGLVSVPVPALRVLALAVMRVIGYCVSHMTPTYKQLFHLVFSHKNRRENGCVGLRDSIFLYNIFPKNFSGYI